MGNVRSCFNIGTNFEKKEFDLVHERAAEYAADPEYPSQSNYAAAASDILHETQAMFDKLMTAVDLAYPETKFHEPVEEPITTKEPSLLDKIGEKVLPPYKAVKNFKAWFGKSTVVDKDGYPKVMYRGTARQDGVILPSGSSEAIFLTDNPTFAHTFGVLSEDREILRRQEEDPAFNPETDLLGSYPNIQPLYVRAEKPFDYKSEKQVDEVIKQLEKWGTFAKREWSERERGPKNSAQLRKSILDGAWQDIENADVQEAIRKLGHDSFYVYEAEDKNLAVYNSNQVKSATGNTGEFSNDSADIRYNRQVETPEFKAWFKDSKVVESVRLSVQINQIVPTEQKEMDTDVLGAISRHVRAGTWDDREGALVVRSRPDGKYDLIDGHHRLAAFKQIGRNTVPVIAEKPLVVYHGTNANIEEFGGWEWAGWFSKSKQHSEDYTRPVDDRDFAGPNVMPVYLSIKNPLRIDVDMNDNVDAIKPLLRKLGLDDDLGNNYGRGPLVYRVVNSDKFSKAVHELGYDGLIVNEGGVETYAPSQPTQIKSAIGNSGAFDGANPDIRYSRQVEDGTTGNDARDQPHRYSRKTVADVLDLARTGKRSYSLPDAIARGHFAEAYQLAKNAVERKEAMKLLGDSLIETAVDSLIPVRRWIESLPVSANLKQAIAGDLYRGDTKRAYLQKEVSSKFSNRMYIAIEKAAQASNKTTDDVKEMAGHWMSARYATTANQMLLNKDRAALRDVLSNPNATPTAIAEAQQNVADRIADIQGAPGAAKVRGVAGGFNNAEAHQVVMDTESHIDRQLLEAIAAPVYEMLEWKKQMDIREGRVSQTAVNGWANDPRYVPMTGDPRDIDHVDDVFSSGNQINQDKEHAMNGRKDSVADDGIDAAFTAVIKSINHAGMQDFKRNLNAVYEEAQASGQDIGLTRSDTNPLQRLSDNAVIYRDTAVTNNGLEFTKNQSFTFKDQAVIGALKKANQEQLNAVLSVIGKGTSLYSRMVTQMSPIFAPINFVRDIWERSETMRVKKLLDRSGSQVNLDKAARASIADVLNPQVWRATAMSSFKRGGMNPVRADLEEFIRHGGASTHGDHLARSGYDLDKDIRKKTGSIARFNEKWLGLVEAYNSMFELVPSLAIYRSLKAQGVEAKDAAAFTLDLMNFRKRGTAMPAIRALYSFAQPNAQSAHNLAQYLSTRKGQVRFMAQIAVGMALYAALRASWGAEDDDELGMKLDNVSNNIIERGVPIKIGDMMLKVPVGFGPPQVAWAMAADLSRWQSGRYGGKDAILEMSKSWVKSFAPVAPSDMEMTQRPVDFFAQSFIPTIFRPLTALALNQDSFGSPLTPQFPNANKMKFEQAKRNTASAYSEIAKDVYDITGVDMYPDHIKQLLSGYALGPLREVLNNAIENPGKRDRGEPENVPILNSLIQNINDRQILHSIYYRHRKEMEESARKYEYMKREDPGEITSELRQQALAFKQFAASEKVFSAQRSALKKMTIDEDLKSSRRIAIEERADAAQRRLLINFINAQ